MRAYHFISEKYGLEALENKTLKVARIKKLNDPFEGLHLDTDNYLIRETLKGRINKAHRESGILCFSENFCNPVQWAHYADSHKGLCLAFDIPDEKIIKIEYVNERAIGSAFRDALDYKGRDFTKYMLSKKYEHWKYEQECRILIDFPEAVSETKLLFHPFSDEMLLSEVIIGCRSQLSPKLVKKMYCRNFPEIAVTKVLPSASEFKMIKL